MNTIHQLVQTHLTKYPLMEAADGAKLLYQNELGPGHMISNEEDSMKRLVEEWESIPHSSSAFLAEPIGNRLVRVYLNSLSRKELPLLNTMFCQTANHIKGSRERFIRHLDCLPLYFPQADNFLKEYEEKGYPAVSHSGTYRTAYHPAYRVVTESHARFLQLIRTINRHMQEKSPLIIAIEGNCASGKTTLSSLFAAYFDCNIIHMDDFFLPPRLRTPSRLAQPGGNIHYERFAEEVMAPLQNGSGVSFRRFCCRIMDYSSTVYQPSKPLTVIEGSYCMHPKLLPLYDYSVFLTCSYERQIERIRTRNGEEMLKNFMEKWIPMENKYFSTFYVKEKCSFVIET